MIKKIKIYITLAAVAFSSVSCLDKYPEDAIPEGDAIRTVEEANQAVIGIYAYMKNPNLYSGLLTLLPDLSRSGLCRRRIHQYIRQHLALGYPAYQYRSGGRLRNTKCSDR